MIKLKKNKTIIIGESGSGKSYTALNIALKKKGTTFICNGCVSKSYYEKSFPSLKEYEDKDGAYNFIPQETGNTIFTRAYDNLYRILNFYMH